MNPQPLTELQKEMAEARRVQYGEQTAKIAAIMVDYCPKEAESRPVIERMGATIIALHNALETAKKKN